MATTDAQLLSLRPPYVALEWYRGRTTAFTVTVEDTNGTPVNITGASATMQIKSASGSVLLTLTTTANAGIALTNPTSGQMTISPEAVGTGTLPISNVLNTDLKLTLSSGVVYVLFRATITLIDKITA
jgi:hypothetical protein